MAENVEQSLEKLLPLFEQLKSVKLLTTGEVSIFIKRCRRYDYRVTKMRKNPSDFLNYAEYLTEMLLLINKRRAMKNYRYKFEQIDAPLQRKVAEIYGRLCYRFPGRLDFFHEQVRFLKDHSMYGQLSRAYARVLQFHGKNVSLRVASARSEFFENNSPENARAQLQIGIRSNSRSVDLWANLYDIEINYVKRLFERRQLLIRKEDDEKSNPTTAAIKAELSAIQDAVFQFKLAEIVRDEALKALETVELQNEFLFKCWEFALKCGNVAIEHSEDLYKRLEQSKSEYFYMTKVYQAAEDEGGDVYSAYDESIGALPTEKMYRLYISYCLERINKNDPYASIRFGELLIAFEEKNFGTQEEFDKWLPVSSLDNQQKLTFTDKLLAKFPSSVVFWQIRLAHIVKQADQEDFSAHAADKKAVSVEVRKNLELFNVAQSKLRPEQLLPIWMLAIDYMLIVKPKKVDALFERAFLEAPSNISAALKSVRLRMIDSLNPHKPDVVRKEYRRLALKVPNSVRFHKDFVEMELARGAETNKLVVAEAYENCIAEFGTANVEVWIDYAKFAMKNKPELMAQLKTRAEVSLPSEQTNLFEAEWSLLMQSC
ncbi:hypothetical protein L596_016584 [Steinernema carpocapsae]|uniref:U3 small nucleolar RNA-associated protein 6 homolog n=1 Tax=Steinernema carpocapsae TaxID=34508 RepID=A0A4U5NJG1_STECR|nr:hypothetical protein L596_016584 [Steinernema carpocapsae]